MAILEIKSNETTVERLEIDSLKLARDYLESGKFQSGTLGTYSTFNRLGVENTIKLIKR